MQIRTDDPGNSTGAATALQASSNGGVSTAVAQGVIERPTDVDYFSFTAGAGNASFSLSPAARSANLDAVLSLRNSAGHSIRP